MLRAVLVSLLVVVPACKDSTPKASDPPAQGTAAGKVVELTGSVSATRDGKTRALAAGADVSGDDTIETGADGHVVIHLAHNNATWDLSANKKQRVDQSLAWTLAKQDTPAATVDQATSAAGRHAERTAADTVATAEPQAQAAAPPAAESAPAKTESPKPAPPPAAAAPPPPPPPPPPAPSPAPGAASGRGAVEDKKLDAEGAALNRRLGAADTGAPSIQVLLEHDRAKLAACLDAATPHLTLTVRVAKGTPKLVITGSTPKPAVRACLVKELEALKLGDGEAKLEL